MQTHPRARAFSLCTIVVALFCQPQLVYFGWAFQCLCYGVPYNHAKDVVADLVPFLAYIFFTRALPMWYLTSLPMSDICFPPSTVIHVSLKGSLWYRDCAGLERVLWRAPLASVSHHTFSLPRRDSFFTHPASS